MGFLGFQDATASAADVASSELSYLDSHAAKGTCKEQGAWLGAQGKARTGKSEQNHTGDWGVRGVFVHYIKHVTSASTTRVDGVHFHRATAHTLRRTRSSHLNIGIWELALMMKKFHSHSIKVSLVTEKGKPSANVPPGQVNPLMYCFGRGRRHPNCPCAFQRPCMCQVISLITDNIYSSASRGASSS